MKNMCSIHRWRLSWNAFSSSFVRALSLARKSQIERYQGERKSHSQLTNKSLPSGVGVQTRLFAF